VKFENYNKEYQEKVSSMHNEFIKLSNKTECYHCEAQATTKCKECEEFYYCSNDHELKEW